MKRASWWLAGILMGLGAFVRCLEEAIGLYVRRKTRVHDAVWS